MLCSEEPAGVVTLPLTTKEVAQRLSRLASWVCPLWGASELPSNHFSLLKGNMSTAK